MSTEDYNRGYSGQAPLPGGGIVAGESHAQGIIDSQRRQPGYNDKTSSAITLVILGVPALLFWAGSGGGGAATIEWRAIVISLVGAALAAGLATWLVLSLLISMSAPPETTGSPRRAFIYAALVSLLSGCFLMWVGLESITEVARDGAAASLAAKTFAGGAGWLIRLGALPLVHGLWESPALQTAQSLGGAGAMMAAALMLAAPVLAFTVLMRRQCGTTAALVLGLLTQSGIAFVAMAVLSSVLAQS